MMDCPNCQTANPAQAKFCMSCGSSLANTCSNCGTELPAEAAFCFNCGQNVAGLAVETSPKAQPPVEPPVEPVVEEEPAQSQLQKYIPKELLGKLEQAREVGAMAGERRIVTMLFCDVKGSTAAASQLDPEEWAEIINGAFEHLITPVYRYEGTVARLMGDGILAFFGAPIAHEDDPQRAILAGLDMLESIQLYCEQIKRRWGLDIRVRVGINTGLVVVGAVGSDLRMEYTALGDAINMAARMEQTAEPGTVQIAADTYRLVAPLFEVQDLGEMSVHGKEQPVRTYRVLAPKAEPGRLRGVEGLESPLVGRDAEMHQLRGAIIELRQGRGQIISVIGEAGLGKSRLLAELRESPAPVAEARGKLQWIEGRSLSYETSTPYAPFIRLFNDCLGLHPEQESDEKYGLIVEAVGQVLPDRIDETAPFIASLLGVTPLGEGFDRVRYLEPPQLRAAVFLAASEYFEALATEQPLVIVIDDLHWVDPTSLELLEQLMPLADRVMLMIVALFRPRRNEPSWRFHELAERDFSHRYVVTHVKPLDMDSSRELVANLLHVEKIPEKTRHLILSKAEGNPFFVEEVIRSLLDAELIVKQNGHWTASREIEDITVPDTLAAVLTTRLDRLDDVSKQVLQTAAVIGREFQFETLADIYQVPQALEASLAELLRRELIREKSRQPLRVYIFKHTLTQETAYRSVLLKNRRQLHRRVGESFEKREAENVNDIARHFREAGDLERALPYFVAAGDRAARAYSSAEAIGFYEEALAILETVGDLTLARRTYEGLGSALTFANEIPQVIETYQAMLGLARSREDVEMQVSALNKISYVSALRLGQFQEAEDFLAESDRLARENEDKAGLSELDLVRSMMCTAVADFDGVVRYMDETVQLGRELAVEEQMALGLAHISSSQIFMLQFDEAWEKAQEGLELSRKIGDLEHEAEILVGTVALYHWRNGDLGASREAAKLGLDIATTIGSINSINQGWRNLGYVEYLEGKYEQALRCFQRYLESANQSGMPWYQAEALCLLGSVYLDISPDLTGRITEYHQQALGVMEGPGGTMLGASAWSEIGFCMLAVDKVDQAADLFQQGLSNPTITVNLERPRLLHGQALVALSRDDLDAASGLLEEAKAIVDKHAMRNYYVMIALAEARLSAARGDLEAALERYERGEELALEIGLRPLLLNARAGAADTLSALGRGDAAELKRRQARATIDEIASFFEDDQLRTLYVENTAGKLAFELTG